MTSAPETEHVSQMAHQSSPTALTGTVQIKTSFREVREALYKLLITISFPSLKKIIPNKGCLTKSQSKYFKLSGHNIGAFYENTCST